MARGLKFRIKKEEGLYYLCSENKGADQLCSYRTADLHLFFAYAKSQFSHDMAHINYVYFYRIRYVHLMAHFRMYRQIKDQTVAFIRGFKSVVNPDWLDMFSSPELQKLISGDTADLDISDMR